TGQPYPTAIETADLGSFAEGLFAAGRLVWTSGANLGAEQHVRRHAVRDGTVLLETWLAPPLEVAIGDTFRVEAGCDRRFETCRDRFANALAFAGFPHIPGDDVAIGYPSEGGSHDGGSLFR
ncbi:MAG: phage BR0599 family protein, partial [Pseudomonadota bacterium]